MKTSIVGLEGDLAGVRFAIGEAPVTFGREEDNDVVITDPWPHGGTLSSSRRPMATSWPTGTAAMAPG